jgi:hypothetical protein
MPQQKIIELAQRVASSDPNNVVEQRSLLEALVEIRTLVDRVEHPRACDYLNGAGLLLTFTQHFGQIGGSQVLGVVATVLEAAHMHVSLAPKPAQRPEANSILKGGTQWGAVQVANDMLLGQILLRKGYIVEEQVKEAVDLQASTGARFGEALMKLGALGWPQLGTSTTSARTWSTSFSPTTATRCTTSASRSTSARWSTRRWRCKPTPSA